LFRDWALRIDFTPTPEQIERGLTDDRDLIQRAWIKRLKVSSDSMLKDEDQVVLLL
jgi:hypothetical protein